MRTAVVILNWNGLQHLQHYLPSVVATTPDADVVVADNGSSDGSVAWLKAEMPSVQLVLLDRNYGFAEGYNRALNQLEGYDTFVLLNSDVEPTEGWLQPLVEQLERNEDVAVVVPKILDDKCRTKFEYAGAAGGFIDVLGYPFCRGRILSTVEEDNGQYDTPCDVMWGSGAAFCCRASVFAELGGFSAEFFAHQEEIDLCWRLRSRGRGVVCVPQSVAYHLGGGTLPQGNPRKTFLNFRNNLLLLYKNLPEERLSRVMRLRFWLDALASIQFLLTMQWGSFLAVWKARRAFHEMKDDFRKYREDNLRKTTLSPVPEQSTFSLLWQYYVKGRKTFMQLYK